MFVLKSEKITAAPNNSGCACSDKVGYSEVEIMQGEHSEWNKKSAYYLQKVKVFPFGAAKHSNVDTK